MTIDVVGSKMKAPGTYGQNAYDGPSSECPDDPPIASGFLPGADLAAANAAADRVMTRDVGRSDLKPANKGADNASR